MPHPMLHYGTAGIKWWKRGKNPREMREMQIVIQFQELKYFDTGECNAVVEDSKRHM